VDGHFHSNLDMFVIIGFSAMVFRALWVLLASWLVQQGGGLEHIGSAMGALA
jgi:hypothetical protein